jgi:hypothetical protein
LAYDGIIWPELSLVILLRKGRHGNRGDNTVLGALQKLAPNLQEMDIATGVFEIGSFLLLEKSAK